MQLKREKLKIMRLGIKNVKGPVAKTMTGQTVASNETGRWVIKSKTLYQNGYQWFKDEKSSGMGVSN